MADRMLLGVPPNFPSTLLSASSDDPRATTDPRYWPSLTSSTDSSTNPRPSAQRARHVARRRPVQSGSEVQPSSPYAWQPLATGRPSLAQDASSIHYRPENTASQETVPVSSLRETASPIPARPDTELAAAWALLDQPRFSLESLRNEYAATGRVNEATYQQVQMHRLQAQQAARRQADQPRASLDNDTTRPEAVTEEAMMLKMECKICFAQISDHALLPCGQ